MAKNQKQPMDDKAKGGVQKNQDAKNKRGPSEAKKRTNECI